MAASINIAVPIFPLRLIGSVGAQVPIRQVIEVSGQTFKIGTPVQIASGSGGVQACPAITSVATAVIFGISGSFGGNLATTGVPQTLTYGSVQNQTAAVLIPVGAPPSFGTTIVFQAISETVFVGKLGNSNTAANATLANTQVGTLMGLTQDAGNLQWYVDQFITTTAAGACVQITELVDPVGTLNGRVGFVVTAAAQQVY